MTTSSRSQSRAHGRDRSRSSDSARTSPRRGSLGADTRTGPRIRVLLVEPCDAAFTRALDALSDARATRVIVDRAYDAESAIAIAARRPPDIALVSSRLSPGERVWVIDTLREAAPSLLAVLLVERRGQAAAAAARAAGATAFLVVTEARAGVLERALAAAVEPNRSARTSSPPPLDTAEGLNLLRSLPR